MGKFMDMLPQMEAEFRERRVQSAIVAWMGCDWRGCTLEQWISPVDFTYALLHNGTARCFNQSMSVSLHDTASPVFDRGSLRPVAWVPRDVAEWVAARHAVEDAQRESERQQAIDADGWLQNAEMVGSLT